MPYKQDYNSKTVKGGASKTPSSVMGSQGASATITPSFTKPRPTKTTKFPKK